MEIAPHFGQHPALLSPGTQVGAWRVVGWAGRGVYGAVYRAVPVGDAHAPEVALKMALLPEDPRFAHEAELLGRMSHPSIPRLLDHGLWHSPGGTRHPFLVMERVDGVPLYDLARLRPLAPAQVLRWLAQLARALEALHTQGAVHRDVKGGNVLVGRTDGRAVLMDFGTGFYPGAITLTPPLWFPGTPAYRSPECFLFEHHLSRDVIARYRAGPADDLYALGVTACRLLTGEYPEFAAPRQDENGRWHLDTVMLPAALMQGVGMEPRLRALVLRMLSVRPEERGPTAQLAEELERAAELAEARALVPQQVPAQVPKAEGTSGAGGAAERLTPPAPARRVWPWLVLAAAGVALSLWIGRAVPSQPEEEASVAEAEVAGEREPEAGPTGLGEAAAATSLEQARHSSLQGAMAEDSPPEPLPGQVRPDAKGKCPGNKQVLINGGCWLEFPAVSARECELNGCVFFENRCYSPALPARRKPPPTSDQPR
jgi:hypothetical protein